MVDVAPAFLLPARIMVVDDVLANLQLLTEMLETQGYDVRPFPSGKLALEAARQEPPDLILLDINMPDLNGYEVCALLKREPALAAIPVIFISGRDEESDKVTGLELGAVDYVTKPIQVRELEARVRTHLELGRLRQELQRQNALLEQKVAERTRELADAKARLVLLDQAKSEFLQLISHEVRTPLQGIFGIGELLLDLCKEAREAARYADLFEQSRRRMETLIGDALLLSEIGAGADLGAQQHCELGDLLRIACMRAEAAARIRGVQLAAGPAGLRPVLGVPKYLVRALQSLLETAIKFARPASTLRLATEVEPEVVVLVIEASGATIPPDLLPRFFDLLAIAKPLTSGGDLGLAPPVAQRILNLYGGSVVAENCTPPGVRFVVRLRVPPCVGG